MSVINIDEKNNYFYFDINDTGPDIDFIEVNYKKLIWFKRFHLNPEDISFFKCIKTKINSQTKKLFSIKLQNKFKQSISDLLSSLFNRLEKYFIRPKNLLHIF